MLIDAHCHLDDDQFASDLDGVIRRAVDAGVVAVVSAGADVASSRAAVGLAQRYDIVYAAVGIHPHHAAAFDTAALAEIRTLAHEPKVVAIGEIGLDFHYAVGAPAEVQTRNLVAHLDLARELGKPVVIHDRDAHRELMEILRSRGPQPTGWQGMLHCFSGDLGMAREAITLGYMISFAGNITFPNARPLAELAGTLSLDHILIETDAPYLSPQPRRGRRNEPAHVAHVAARIATLRGIAPDQVAKATLRNSIDLYGLRTAG